MLVTLYTRQDWVSGHMSSLIPVFYHSNNSQWAYQGYRRIADSHKTAPLPETYRQALRSFYGTLENGLLTPPPSDTFRDSRAAEALQILDERLLVQDTSSHAKTPTTRLKLKPEAPPRNERVVDVLASAEKPRKTNHNRSSVDLSPLMSVYDDLRNKLSGLQTSSKQEETIVPTPRAEQLPEPNSNATVSIDDKEVNTHRERTPRSGPTTPERGRVESRGNVSTQETKSHLLPKSRITRKFPGTGTREVLPEDIQRKRESAAEADGSAGPTSSSDPPRSGETPYRPPSLLEYVQSMYRRAPESREDSRPETNKIASDNPVESPEESDTTGDKKTSSPSPLVGLVRSMAGCTSNPVADNPSRKSTVAAVRSAKSTPSDTTESEEPTSSLPRTIRLISGNATDEGQAARSSGSVSPSNRMRLLYDPKAGYYRPSWLHAKTPDSSSSERGESAWSPSPLVRFPQSVSKRAPISAVNPSPDNIALLLDGTIESVTDTDRGESEESPLRPRVPLCCTDAVEKKTRRERIRARQQHRHSAVERPLGNGTLLQFLHGKQ